MATPLTLTNPLDTGIYFSVPNSSGGMDSNGVPFDQDSLGGFITYPVRLNSGSNDETGVYFTAGVYGDVSSTVFYPDKADKNWWQKDIEYSSKTTSITSFGGRVGLELKAAPSKLPISMELYGKAGYADSIPMVYEYLNYGFGANATLYGLGVSTGLSYYTDFSETFGPVEVNFLIRPGDIYAALFD